jgi:citrate synthase
MVFDTALEVERVAIRELGPNGIYPNTDFWNSVYYYFIDIPPEYFTVNFALARIAGWAGHALEYWQANRLIRPRSVYIGPAEAQYVPIEDR